jgi:predicted glycoside hydrolase/deacetylase ChbG (UPF0249 family)
MSAVRLIVNADDFGLSDGVNAGIIRAHEHGVVTSASLMVHGRSAAAAATYAQGNRALDLGLHIDLGEWRYVESEWCATYERVDSADADATAAEIELQLELFSALVGNAPTHLDSHQHVHQDEPAASIIDTWAARLGIPARGRGVDIRYEGGFYGQAGKGDPWPSGITSDALCSLLCQLPAGVTELGCHPGIADDSGSQYATERDVEVTALCSQAVRAALHYRGVELTTFSAL